MSPDCVREEGLVNVRIELCFDYSMRSVKHDLAIRESCARADGMVLVFKMAVRLATKLGKNHNVQFANCWKRRINIAAWRRMLY